MSNGHGISPNYAPPILTPAAPLPNVEPEDRWIHRSQHMRCRTCLYWLVKARDPGLPMPVNPLGRCRRHAPTMSGWPANFADDWCGDHKLDENRT